jgi:hypothetical protein
MEQYGIGFNFMVKMGKLSRLSINPSVEYCDQESMPEQWITRFLVVGLALLGNPCDNPLLLRK